MSTKPRAVTQINLVARRYQETLTFYRLIGLALPPPLMQPPGALHAPARSAGGVAFEIDNEYLARIYHAGWRQPARC